MEDCIISVQPVDSGQTPTAADTQITVLPPGLCSFPERTPAEQRAAAHHAACVAMAQWLVTNFVVPTLGDTTTSRNNNYNVNMMWSSAKAMDAAIVEFTRNGCLPSDQLPKISTEMVKLLMSGRKWFYVSFDSWYPNGHQWSVLWNGCIPVPV